MSNDYRRMEGVTIVDLDKSPHLEGWLKIVLSDNNLLHTNNFQLGLLYSSREHDKSVTEMRRGVGNTEGLLIIIYTPRSIFGAYINGGLQPDQPTTRSNSVRIFSVLGHFSEPKSIPCAQYVEPDGVGANVNVGGSLYLGCNGARPVDNILCCHQQTDEKIVPVGYMGQWNSDGYAVLGGESDFDACGVDIFLATL